ncbi:MAG: PilZ domain-containing protein [Archangium sp.]|nr:PilZ domain-containing protein [Archangium sp.]MDP3573816.1 PilZ domain-containing protein [Archangium sp.]
MLIERQQRESRVRFEHPIRVVTLERQPRVIRTVTSNVSRDGLFVRMPEPLPTGTKVALSLEAGGRALALAQAEVVWTGADTTEVTERFPGCGVKFTEFMHPRAEELVRYLVHNLDQGKPLALAPPEKRWMKWLPLAAGVALVACAALAVFVFWGGAEPELEEEVPALELVAAPPIVHVSPSPLREEGRGEGPAAPVAAKEVEAAPVAATEVEATPVIAKEAAPSPVIPSEVEGSVPPRAEGAPSIALGANGAMAPSTPLAATAAPSKPAPQRANKPDQQGRVKLPSGAATSLTWTIAGTELRLTPELTSAAKLTRAFLLTGPPRAVFDLSGPSPEKSHTVPSAPPYATAVRLGKQPTGTRIVIDLDSAPRRATQDGSTLILEF